MLDRGDFRSLDRRATIRALALAVVLMLTLGGWSIVEAAPNRGVVAFCEAHPVLDFPDAAFYGSKRRPGRVPPVVKAVDATNWRCADGKVLVCNGGAAGSACWKMDASRKPNPDVRAFCAENPDADFVAMAMIGNSASTWRCRGTTPEIIKTVPLDRRGFMAETWKPLTDSKGKVRRDMEFEADPR